ncbi:MAG TPA: hypothetical protein VGJ13_04960 [Pseudonocardiaceae bacterium]|jgi:hypothetical protein
MSTPRTTGTKTPEQQAAELSKLRPIQKLQPGWWWLGDYYDQDGCAVQLWSRINIVAESTHPTFGQIVHLRGKDTTGDFVEMDQRRGYAIESLTEAQATRCGLTIPEADPR